MPPKYIIFDYKPPKHLIDILEKQPLVKYYLTNKLPIEVELVDESVVYLDFEEFDSIQNNDAFCGLEPVQQLLIKIYKQLDITIHDYSVMELVKKYSKVGWNSVESNQRLFTIKPKLPMEKYSMSIAIFDGVIGVFGNVLNWNAGSGPTRWSKVDIEKLTHNKYTETLRITDAPHIMRESVISTTTKDLDISEKSVRYALESINTTSSEWLLGNTIEGKVILVSDV